MIAVMGATGHTGRKITERLLQAGQKVRALGRSETKLADLARGGAEVWAGDASDLAFLTRAFEGVDAAYTLLPPDPGSLDYRASQDAHGEAIVKALAANRVRYIVGLSSVGADVASGTGPIDGLHAQERRLRGLEGANVLILRPGSFFENFHEALGLIRHQGLNGDSVAPDVALPMIATHDIAVVAAEALATRHWRGVAVRELLGPRDLTYGEATRILGERIGQPALPYVQLPDSEMIQALTQAGCGQSFAGLYVEMTRAFNEGRVRSREGRNPANTTPTRFEDFADELARAYHAG